MNTPIAFVTVDTVIQFYKINKSSETSSSSSNRKCKQPERLIVMSDINEPFIPSNIEDFFIIYNDTTAPFILEFCDYLISFYSSSLNSKDGSSSSYNTTGIGGTALGAALKTCYQVLTAIGEGEGKGEGRGRRSYSDDK